MIRLINKIVNAAQLGGVLEEGKVSHITRNLFLTLAANGKIGEANQVDFFQFPI